MPEDVADAMVDAMRDLPVELDLWVDAEDRMRRTRMTMDLAPLLVAGAGAGGQSPPGLDEATMTMTSEVYDYGVAVHVEVPEDVEEHTSAGSPATGSAGMAGASGAATLEVEDGPQGATTFTLWGDDGQHQSGTANAVVSIGPATERGVRGFVDVDLEGTIEGWGLHGSVRCRPDGEA